MKKATSDRVKFQSHPELPTLLKESNMKITVDVDITPEELRHFLGLPNIEGLQEEMMRMAQQQLTESGQNMYNEIIAGAVQPMMAYQQWLQRVMLGGSSDSMDSDKSEKEKK
ncbi:MAG: hypothetical protein ACI8Z1_001445 [Candidatus Azotimanducaceae bacterium]